MGADKCLTWRKTKPAMPTWTITVAGCKHRQQAPTRSEARAALKRKLGLRSLTKRFAASVAAKAAASAGICAASVTGMGAASVSKQGSN